MGEDNTLDEIERIAESSAWEKRLSSIDLIRSHLTNLPSEKAVERILIVLTKLVADPKWEVRKALIPVLGLIRRPVANELIVELTNDRNQWVRNSAKQAKRKIERVTSAGEKRDSRANFTFDSIKDIDSKSGKKLYDAAVRIGEKAYEELAGDTAHELNTFRASLGGLLEELEKRIEESTNLSQPVRDLLDRIDERAEYLRLLTDGLIEYARDIEPEFEEKPLLPVVQSAFVLAREKCQKSDSQQIVEETEIPADLSFEASWDRLFLAFVNLLSNAIEAVKGQERDRIVKFCVGSVESDHVVLTISDTGCGMEATQTENAKRPFRSLKKHQGGIGLGLPLAVKIIEREHRGKVEIESKLDVGTNIIIELPTKHEGQ